MTKSYNKYNFHNQTFCIWNEVDFDEIKEFKFNYKSKSGSSYIFTEIGVYRISNHWGRVSNCRWRLNSSTNYKNQKATVGFAKWINFLPNDEVSKLFFIKVNFETNKVDFFHKESNDYDGKAILRNANQTSKVIQNIKIVLIEITWSKHLQFEDLDILRKEICLELINSEQSLVEIKRKFI